MIFLPFLWKIVQIMALGPWNFDELTLDLSLTFPQYVPYKNVRLSFMAPGQVQVVFWF